jgi:pyruvate/2-oxoglutarate dehydrogenase complex dihydrolipoamide dehydrogenase (E3) component
VPERFVILGGGPAGNVAATYAARLGAEVTVVERDVIGGAAHLWDCIPSKSMIATGGAMSFMQRSEGMGLENETPTIDTEALTARIGRIKDKMSGNTTELLQSQNVRLIRGSGRFTGPHTMEVVGESGTEQIEFDSALVSTGSRSQPLRRVAERRSVMSSRIQSGCRTSCSMARQFRQPATTSI